MTGRSHRPWPYRPMDWFTVRTPLIPVEPASGLSMTAPSMADPRVSLALWIGSPDLWDSIHGPNRVGAVPGSPRPAPDSTVKARHYLDRMSNRPTPYGLFAGVALGSWASRTDLRVRQMPGRTFTRLDMGWLLALVEQLEADIVVRRQLGFVCHSAVLVSAGRLYLLDPPATASPAGEPTREAWPTGCLSLRATTPVLALLEAARNTVPYERLLEAVDTAAPGSPIDRVEVLIERLRRAGVLQSDLRPALTVPDPGRYLAQRLADVTDAASRPQWLRWLTEEVSRCDTLDAVGGLALRRSLTGAARRVLPGVSPVLQTDATVELAGTGLHRSVARAAMQAVDLLLRTSTLPARPADLVAYQRAFEERYGWQRSVPLLELINPHVGLGFPEDRGETPAGAVVGTGAPQRDDVLVQLAARALALGIQTVELDDRMLAHLEHDVDPRDLPPTLELMATVEATDVASIDAGDFALVVSPAVGSSAAGRTLGRFLFLLGEQAHHKLQAEPHTDSASHRGGIDVDLVYQPLQARAANVAICPARQGHIIRIGVGAHPQDPPAIPLDEITLCLEEGGLVARWGSRGPRLRLHTPHMVNWDGAPRLARFLLRIGQPPVLQSFDWGAAHRLPFLPRLTRGAVVLSSARWRLGPTLLPAEGRAQFPAALREFRTAWRMPGVVRLVEYDNHVTVDLDRAEDVEEIRRKLRRSGTVVLQQYRPPQDQAWLPGPDGRRVAEIVVPFVRNVQPGRAEHAVDAEHRDRTPALHGRAATAADRVVRWACPGSQWIYVKVYAPSVTHDDLITGTIHHLAGRLLRSGTVLAWHFLRYRDPDSHLRLRFKLTDCCHWPAAAAELSHGLQADMAEGLISRFAFDTYDREIERFGGPDGIDFAECVFCADSTSVLGLLRSIGRRRIALNGAVLAVVTIDRLLADLGLAPEDRQSLAESMDRGSDHTAGTAFRASKAELRDLLGARGLPPPVESILATRGSAIASALRAQPHGADWFRYADRATDIAAAFTHLHCNRLFGIDRAQEQLVYGLLARTRRSISRWSTPVSPKESG
ncbi:thiopeptide-type bacteriocin biosynthesis protein [Streptomyces umbrinus]|uniref:Thiopeptide-type bacteriocin biosynthesis protein n=1 Tax=Streptomyces umbrinus TaxID=67370 RepID=A0ABU0T7H6_9ACTN|nr:lantibiotic dehydratase [Streptomyces umbrinus]MDQ1031643.1 thiopeptide-type bacteriocin biosynthesis protein [Streptomyces umbrinus]